MANVKEIFLTTINNGLEATKLISDSKDKAIAYAEIAKALAMTGLVRDAVLPKDVNVNVDDKNEIKEEAAKATKKKNDKKVKKEDSKKIIEEPKTTKEEVTEDEPKKELDWNDVSKEVEALNSFREEFGDETIEQCIADFSEGSYSSLEDISPANINAFITYLNLLKEDAE